MNYRKHKIATWGGVLALSAGLALHIWADGTFAHFASGFLLGISIALLILGLAGRARDIS